MLTLAFSPLARAGSSSETTSRAPSAAGNQITAKTIETIRVQFHDSTLELILEYFTKTTGITVVAEEPLGETGRVTMASVRPCTADEFVSLLQAVLASQGFVGVRNGTTLLIRAHVR